MTDPFVPKHAPRPFDARTCGYSPTPGSGYCRQPATWHVMWDHLLDNSFTCDRHMALIQTRWVYDDRHPVAPDCGMPTALWLYKANRCAVPEVPSPQEAVALIPQEQS